jgi:gluconate 2-dehydrogenase alpha chain
VKGSGDSDLIVHDEVDAVIVGIGWCGGILAAELTRAGLRVVGLERGPDNEPPPGRSAGERDELRRRRFSRVQDTGRETWTLRHNSNEEALPMRYPGAFTPGSGVGGSSLLYGGHAYRLQPWEFVPRSSLLGRYGPEAFAQNATPQDWGITYDELESSYDRFERAAGIGGRAGNLQGQIISGGNPFEGPREREFPVPPPAERRSQTVFRQAAERMGYRPYPVSSGTLSEAYVNPDGLERQACTYCGFCAGHRCEIGAKADATVTVLPIARKSGLFDLRANSQVRLVLHDGTHAFGVRYSDENGRLHEQRASVVILSAYALSNVRLLLLSGLGRPYDPVTGSGVVGRNYAYNFVLGARAFFNDQSFESYVGAGGAGTVVGEFNCDNFDHTGLDFLGGGVIFTSSGGTGPLNGAVVPPGIPSWGLEWKRAVRKWYDHSVAVSAHGLGMPYRTNFLDLDPVYRDAWGDPLLRITFDWGPNEQGLYRFLRARMLEIAHAMRADHVAEPAPVLGHFDAATYMSTHNTGGAIMGSDPSTSVVNPWLQMWDVDNVWVVGGSAMPQAPGTGLTGTICALAYRAAAGIVDRYRDSPSSVS